MKYITLNNGIEIPTLGFGVFMIPDNKICVNSVAIAIQDGYRLIDTAAIYQNEGAVGEGIRVSGINREELFVTSKLWLQDYGYEKTKKAIDKTLQRLKIDYLDMYLQHHHFAGNLESWKAMEEACNEGKIRAIGVCNYPIHAIEELLQVAEIKPVVNQVECHPIFQQKELRKFLKENNIRLGSWGPLGQGAKELLSDPKLVKLAEKYGKETAQVILRWHIQKGMIAIPKSTTPSRIKSNFEIWDFELTEEDLNVIRSMDTNLRKGPDPDDKAYKNRIGSYVANI
ncbi:MULTISPECIES: aldo/keto reductase [unclassified Clostridium]|uniref:aldo/keto reductase n=1 Tax=unclassified Clostridium TaxID=2614128 RepID=UPI00029778AC|nr:MULTISPECIES: aldo/keto reductase [unclassified Clostridium]EKQ57117.1 MAG: aldo/keto reductase, diketogulonate reductase [Clostridium sp. Maddingley MBC34-26]